MRNPEDFASSESPDMTTSHEAMRERLSPTRDSNQIRHDPVGTDRRLQRESDAVGNGNEANVSSDNGAADTRR